MPEENAGAEPVAEAQPEERQFDYRVRLSPPTGGLLRRISEIVGTAVGYIFGGPVGGFAARCAVGGINAVTGVYNYSKEKYASGLNEVGRGLAYLIDPFLGAGVSAAEGAYYGIRNKLFPHQIEEHNRVGSDYLESMGYLGD